MKRTLLACALLLAPLPAQAHPCLEGAYIAPLPCPGVAVYEFGPSEFVCEGVWKGCVRQTVAGRLVSIGTYQLRMFSNDLGIVCLREGQMISTTCGTVDLRKGTFDFIGTTYRR